MIALYIFLSIINVSRLEKVPAELWYIWLHSVTVEQMNVTGHIFSLQSTVMEMKYFDYAVGKTTIIDVVNILPKSTTVHNFKGWADLPNGKPTTAAFMVIQARTTVPVDFVVIVTHNNGAVECMRVLQFSQWNKQYSVILRDVDQNLLLLCLKDCTVKINHSNSTTTEVKIRRLLPYIIFVPKLATRIHSYKGITLLTADPIGVIVLAQTKVEDMILFYPAEMLKTLTEEDWWYDFYILNTSLFDVEYYIIAEKSETTISVHRLDEVQEITMEQLSTVYRLMGEEVRKTTIKITSDNPFMAYCIIGPTESYTRMAQFQYNMYIVLAPKGGDVRHFLLLISDLLGRIQIEDEFIEDSEWLERNPLSSDFETGVIDISNKSDIMYVQHVGETETFLCYVLGLAHPPQGFYIFASDTTKTKVELELEDIINPTTTMTPQVFFEASEYQFECPSGHHGEDCSGTCNCDGTFCKRDGSCYSASCRRGSFGPRCLLEDISVYALEFSPEELFNGDPVTCVTPSNDQIQVKLFEEFHTSMLTVVLKTAESVPVSSFDVLLENETDSYQARLNTTIQADNTVDFIFAESTAFKKMTVSLKNKLEICSFHISGGVNFLRGKDPNFAIVSFPWEETAVQEQYLKVVTDGDRYKTCIGSSGNTKFALETKDRIPKLFYKIAIYTDNETEFKLTLQTDNMVDFTTNVIVKPKRAGIIQLNRLIIFLALESITNKFSICEIEIYTDITALDLVYSESNASDDESGDSPYVYIGVAGLLVFLAVVFVCYKRRSNRRDSYHE